MSGTVSTGGSPIAGANVHVYDANSGAYLTSVQTNGSGFYTVTLSAGSYKLATQTADAGWQWYGGTTGFAGANTYTLGPSQTVDINVVSSFTVSGTVSTGGSPIAGANVHVYDANSGAYLTSVQTNGSGFYTVTLSAGSYKLATQTADAGWQWYGGTTGFAGANTYTLGPSQTVDINVV